MKDNEMSVQELEEGKELRLDFKKLDMALEQSPGVIPVAVQNAQTNEVILIAYSNREAFEKSIRTGQPLNNGEDGAISTLTCILGRMAAYKKQEVTWEQMMKSNEKAEFNLTL